MLLAHISQIGGRTFYWLLLPEWLRSRFNFELPSVNACYEIIIKINGIKSLLAPVAVEKILCLNLRSRFAVCHACSHIKVWKNLKDWN